MSREKPIRILVVDDSVLYRKILAEIVHGLPEAQLIAMASGGAAALKRLAAAPLDLVLLDVFMPEMDGVETLAAIRRDFPEVAVIMIGGASTRDSDVIVQALEMGALDFIAKPEGADAEESQSALMEDIRRALRLVQIRRHTRPAPRSSETEASPPAPAARTPMPSTFEWVLIGVSTGGPNALNAIIPRLPGDLGCPILLVQHMPSHFTASLAEHLERHSALAVREAVDNEPILPNTVYIAPGGRHMTVRNKAADPTKFCIGLNDTPPVNSCRPAVDVLFRSAAAAARGGILAVILTGMGEDGAAGMAALKRRGCYCLVQDEKTSVIYGMPRAVAERGLADEILPLDAIASRIETLVNKRGTSASRAALSGN
ncbi:MAG TPA: chemotaxis response regulator protein-glutamate methylesterase [Verrucomicrobia bacterium]|nr:MAG: hypothetical protein A2X46_12260 [Lentisphaerae bacterium GWF2_57_35]HBA84064.1 chemotaxis response regulator protein-glutamate methylesterase [Verrucomicrobiota bacterium]